jgi:hypothetical protein
VVFVGLQGLIVGFVGVVTCLAFEVEDCGGVFGEFGENPAYD